MITIDRSPFEAGEPRAPQIEQANPDHVWPGSSQDLYLPPSSTLPAGPPSESGYWRYNNINLPRNPLNGLPLRDLVEHYSSQQEQTLSDLTAQAWQNSNEAFKRANPRLLVSIPASFQEEPDSIHRTLEQFEQQRLQGAPPFNVCISCNSPEGEDKTAILQAVYDFQANYPDLPLAFFAADYPLETTIGKIRKDVNDVSIELLRTFGDKVLPNIALVSEDADLVKLSRRFLPQLYDALWQGASFAQANRRHERSDGNFPNMDQVMFWYDLLILFSPAAKHDVHNAVSLREYILAGGLDPSATKYESVGFQNHALEVVPGFNSFRPRGAYAVSSSRRAYWHMQRGIHPLAMWEGTFDMEEPYRANQIAYQDITPELATDMIEYSMKNITREGLQRSRSQALGLRDTFDAKEQEQIQAEAEQWAHDRIEQLRRVGTAITTLS